jgi:hypothetical protein
MKRGRRCSKLLAYVGLAVSIFNTKNGNRKISPLREVSWAKLMRPSSNLQKRKSYL